MQLHAQIAKTHPPPHITLDILGSSSPSLALASSLTPVPRRRLDGSNDTLYCQNQLLAISPNNFTKLEL